MKDKRRPNHYYLVYPWYNRKYVKRVSRFLVFSH